MTSSAWAMTALAAAVLLPAGAMAQTAGSATWYGARGLSAFTSSGDRFDEEAMTAASNRLPMGSKVRVTMPDTGQSVVVKINDRIGGNAILIDLTKGAARQIGLLGRGRANVTVTPAEEPLEVADATMDEAADPVTAAPRGRPRMRRAARWAALGHPYYR